MYRLKEQGKRCVSFVIVFYKNYAQYINKTHCTIVTGDYYASKNNSYRR